MAARLRMSRAEAARLSNWAMTDAIAATTSKAALARTAYRGDRQAVQDRLRLGLAGARARAGESADALAQAGNYLRLLRFLEEWKKPVFPVRGADLATLGMAAGPHMGKALAALEEQWVDGGFREDRDALLARAAQLAQQT